MARLKCCGQKGRWHYRAQVPDGCAWVVFCRSIVLVSLTKITLRGASVSDSNARQSVLESNGVNPVPENERHGRSRDLFFVWFAWNVSIMGISYGIYVYGLGLSPLQAIVAGTLGYLLSSFLVGILSVGGPRSGQSHHRFLRLPVEYRLESHHHHFGIHNRSQYFRPA